jgi:hypothetical protein
MASEVESVGRKESARRREEIDFATLRDSTVRIDFFQSVPSERWKTSKRITASRD